MIKTGLEHSDWASPYGINNNPSYITRERIKLAKQLLADPALNITEACYRSGFNNLNYFMRQFRRLEGVPPRVFRQHKKK